ncbi:MAG: Cof-type HAD-IIB family hydrolase [Flavobacteriaceae bacterium]|nr:Cof-type HAD-IIB family hydrolase [Flavobacteriaceae bacterium]
MDLSNIKLVVTDMDGTLLNSNNRVSDKFFELFNALHKRDVHFIAASGRQYASIIDKLDPIKKDITVIAENGGFVLRNDHEILKTQLPETRIQQLIPILRNIKDAHFTLCGKKTAYIETQNDRFVSILEEYYSKFTFVNDLSKVKHDDFFKMAVYHFEGSEQFIYPYVKHLNGDMQVKVSGAHWVDISQPNANKGYALNKVQQQMGISAEETMVFGDYNNDLEMLALGSYSYAMANAHLNVKKAARYLTKSNDEEGVEIILEQLLKAKN